MLSSKKKFSIPIWWKYFLIGQASVEIVAVLVYTLTELGNIGSNFWLTNVFAGSWSGLLFLFSIPVLFIHAICLPTPTWALVAFILTSINLVADGTLIVFNAIFLAQPSTCILTSSCSANSVSTTIFSYTFQQNFYAVFNSLGPFKTYSQSQSKYLFQTVQISVGCLCFVVHLAHVILYILMKTKVIKKVTPIDDQDYPAPQPSYQDDYPVNQPSYQQPKVGYRPTPRAPQPAPGEVPWKNRKY